jgi:tetratricopeptide (TPR) repeat protein/transcriptional regulator with XRE-family HTH domain
MTLSELGPQIRVLRQRAGLTQEELAERSSLSARSLRDLESGRVTKPRLKSIRLIASALELSTEEARLLLGALAGERPAVAARTPTRLNQLPAADPHFTGRFAELRALDVLVSEPRASRIVTISAIGGSGKTALAVHWAHRATPHFPDGQIYVDLLGFTPNQTPLHPTEALGRILTALEVAPDEQPTTLEERSALFRSLIADRRLLVVLDNAATTDQVRPLLPGSPTCATIVTSRERLAGLIVREGAGPLLLDAMTEAEAGELLRGLLGASRVDEDTSAAAEIIELCGRLPLAVRVIGAGLALGNHRTLREAADELATADRLERLSLPDDPAASVLPAFQISYDRLPDDLRLLFGRLGVLPGTSFGPNVIASLMASTAAVANGQLQRLAALNLVQQHSAGRFGMHDLVKLFARRFAEPDDSALRRALDYYLQSADAANHHLRPSRVRSPIDPLLTGVTAEEFETRDAALRWCLDEVATVTDAVELANASGLYGPAIQLPTAMIDFFHIRRQWPVLLTTHERALEAARSQGDKEREGILLSGIGTAYHELRQYDEAVRYLDSAAAIARDGNHRFPLARALSALAILALDQGDHESAVIHFAECEGIAAEVGDSYGAMLATHNSGFAYLSAGNLSRARAAFEKALAMSRQVGATEISAGSINMLAKIMQLDGQPEQALARFRESAALAQETNNLTVLAHAQGNIAETLAQLGRPGEAGSAFRAALRVADELGDPVLRADLQTGLDQLATEGT